MSLSHESQLLIMMQGVPGAGKSRFAKGYSSRTGAVRLSSDEMGAVLWGNVNQSRGGENKELKFNALRYAAGQILVAGQSVIIDAQHSAVTDRQRFTSLIDEFRLPAFPVIAWVETDLGVAKDRVLNRPCRADAFIKSPKEVKATIERSVLKLEMPEAGEYMAILSGLDSLNLQIDSFESQVNMFRSAMPLGQYS